MSLETRIIALAQRVGQLLKQRAPLTGATFTGQVKVEGTAAGTPAFEAKGASAGWLSGLKLDNTTNATGRAFGVYASESGTFAVTDETGGGAAILELDGATGNLSVSRGQIREGTSRVATLGPDNKLKSDQLPTVTVTPNPAVPLPSWYGLTAWTGDPQAAFGTSKPTGGQLLVSYARAETAKASGSIATLYLEVTVAGASLALSKAGIYRKSGSTWQLVGATADQATSWTSIGLKTIPCTLTGAIAAGDELYLACLVSAGSGTVPTFRTAHQAGSALLNVRGFFRQGVVASQSDLPATLGGLTATNVAPFMAMA